MQTLCCLQCKLCEWGLEWSQQTEKAAGTCSIPWLERHAGTADCPFRICPGQNLHVQNFTLSLSAADPPTSVFPFPSRVLTLRAETGIKLANVREENGYKLQLRRSLASDPPKWTSCFSLPLCSVRFTGLSWAIEQGQRKESRLLQPQPQGSLASHCLVSAQQRPCCLKGKKRDEPSVLTLW